MENVLIYIDDELNAVFYTNGEQRCNDKCVHCDVDSTKISAY